MFSSIIEAVIGLQLLAFFLFLVMIVGSCKTEDYYLCFYFRICDHSFFSLFFFLNNKRCYFIKTVVEGSLLFLCAFVVTEMSDLPPFFLA